MLCLYSSNKLHDTSNYELAWQRRDEANEPTVANPGIKVEEPETVL